MQNTFICHLLQGKKKKKKKKDTNYCTENKMSVFLCSSAHLRAEVTALAFTLY